MPVKIRYDPEVDVLRIVLSEAPVEESEEFRPGVILDYDAGGRLVGIEVLRASEQVGDPMPVE